MASEHGLLRSPVTGIQVWGGQFTITTAGALGSSQIATVTDSNFTSAIVRASARIILSAANDTAAGSYRTSTSIPISPWARCTNNASIILTYASPGAGNPASWNFLIFHGGTNT